MLVRTNILIRLFPEQQQMNNLIPIQLPQHDKSLIYRLQSSLNTYNQHGQHYLMIADNKPNKTPTVSSTTSKCLIPSTATSTIEDPKHLQANEEIIYYKRKEDYYPQINSPPSTCPVLNIDSRRQSIQNIITKKSSKLYSNTNNPIVNNTFNNGGMPIFKPSKTKNVFKRMKNFVSKKK